MVSVPSEWVNDPGLIAWLDGLPVLRDLVKDYVFFHFEFGDEFSATDIAGPMGMSLDDAEHALMNHPEWHDYFTGKLLMSVDMISEDLDRYKFVKAQDEDIVGWAGIPD